MSHIFDDHIQNIIYRISADILDISILPAKAAEESGSHFWKKNVLRGIMLKGKKKCSVQDIEE